MTTIIDYRHPESVKARKLLGKNKYNGAYFYSKEISSYFIPTIETDRNWITIKAGEAKVDHSIVFVHDLWKFEQKYGYLFDLKDLIWVVCMPDMVDVVRSAGQGPVVYLPLSVDVPYVEKFKREKDKYAAFVGRTEWRVGIDFPDGTDFVEMMPRDQLLAEMARYEKVYAVSRTAIEARVLDCDILPYHPRYPDPELWQVIDSRDAAKMLQRMLDDIDGR